MLEVIVYFCIGMAIYGNSIPVLRSAGHDINYGHVVGSIVCVAAWPLALVLPLLTAKGRAMLIAGWKLGKDKAEAEIQSDPVRLARRTARRAKRAAYWAGTQEERNAAPMGFRFKMWLRQLLKLPK